MHNWSTRTPGEEDEIRQYTVLVCLFVALFLGQSVRAQHQTTVLGSRTFEQVDHDWRDCGLRNVPEDIFSSVRRPPAKRQSPAATIEVEYGDGFTDAARDAFHRAVEIWERHIASSVTIRIEADFEPLDARTLGGARSELIYAVDRNGDDQIDTVYGDALVDALTGEDQNASASGDPTPPDIVASFNSARDDWYFGAGDAPAGTIDFTTVVLHEIAHGLNYFDVYSSSDGVGEYGRDWDGSGSIEEDERFVGVYGKHVAQEQPDGSFRALNNEVFFPSPSEALGDALRSDRLFFNGPAASAAAEESTGPVPPKLYAPDDYSSQSSVAHLDERTYGLGTIDALMTPRIGHAETLRQPGPITCGQMADMGWTLGSACAFERVVIQDMVAEQRQATQGRVQIRWQLSEGAAVRGFVVEQQFFGRLQQRKRISATGPGEYSTTISGLRVGDHTFRLNYVTADSATVRTEKTASVTVEAQQPQVSVYPNPFRDVANITFVLPEQQRVRVEVFDALGRHVATPFAGPRPANDSRPVVFDAGRLPELASGLYFFRVTGETFRATTHAMHVR